MSIGGLQIQDSGLAFRNLVNGGVRSFAGLGQRGTPNQFSLPIGAIIQNKTGRAILDCGANTDGDSVFLELFDLANF